MEADVAVSEMAATQQLYAERGYLVMASDRPMGLGPFEDNDWNEDDMAAYRWRVVRDATKADLEEQNRLLGVGTKIDRAFRWFYRIEAMD